MTDRPQRHAEFSLAACRRRWSRSAVLAASFAALPVRTAIPDAEKQPVRLAG